MSLATYQAAAARVCFDAEIADEDLAHLGHPERWRIYRSMVRARLRRVVGAALPRTRATLRAKDPAAFETLSTSWLAATPPSTRLFRDVPAGFVAHAGTALGEYAPWAPALARYEHTLWEVKAADDRSIPDAGPIDFAAPLVLDSSVRLLTLPFAVHVAKHAEEPDEGTYRLCVYRNARFEAVTMKLNPVAYALVGRWQTRPEESVTESVQHVAEERGIAIDQSFIDGLASMLEDFLARAILRGGVHPGEPA